MVLMMMMMMRSGKVFSLSNTVAMILCVTITLSTFTKDDDGGGTGIGVIEAVPLMSATSRPRRRRRRWVDLLNDPPEKTPPQTSSTHTNWNANNHYHHHDHNHDNHQDTAASSTDVQTLYMEQHLDHFRLEDSRTFQQRYFYSDRFVLLPTANPTSSSSSHRNHQHNTKSDTTTTTTTSKRSNNHNIISYAFLCVGGEGPALDESVLIDSVHCTGDMLELAEYLYNQNNDNNNNNKDSPSVISIHLFALEHRYYGESYPVFSSSSNTSNDDNGCHSISSSSSSSSSSCSSPVSNENLVYLSSRQALADLAHFVSNQTEKILHEQQQQQQQEGLSLFHKYNNDHNQRLQWVTFGGSYPGMLAAWARFRFPHFITAAVSSSAPVQATLDFPQYNQHIDRVLSMSAVGGSVTCRDIVETGHDQLSDILQTVNHNETTAAATARQQIAQDFNLCNASTILNDPQNIAVFLGDGVINVGTQGNDPACTEDLCNIAKKCQALIHSVHVLGKTPMESLQQLAAAQQELQNKTKCIDVSWNHVLELYSDPMRSQEGGLRSWSWQTCTEFGFYQTCPLQQRQSSSSGGGSSSSRQEQCPFGKGWHTVDLDLELCRHAFGIKALQVKQAIQETLDEFGGWNLTATNILSMNGNVDPWSELAILPPSSSSSTWSRQQQQRKRRSKTKTTTTKSHSTSATLPTAYMVPGASHHFWTHPSKVTDGPEVVAARQLIYNTVIRWLQDEKEQKDHETAAYKMES